MQKQRVLNIQHGYNFRELGGYPTTDGHHVQWRRILRSGELSDLSTADLDLLAQFHIKYDIDLRSDTERQQASDKLPGHAQLVANPIFNSGHDRSESQYAQQYMYDDSLGKQNMIATYQAMVTQAEPQQAFKRFFQVMLKTTQGAVLFHCAQGKDRTGLSAAFLLLALGVDEATVKEDYLLSRPAMEPFIQHKIKQYGQYGMSDALKQNLRDLYTVDESYFDAAMNTIKDKYGSIDHFLHQFIGLSDQDIQKLRDLYLTD